jgi:hypothetical protein
LRCTPPSLVVAGSESAAAASRCIMPPAGVQPPACALSNCASGAAPASASGCASGCASGQKKAPGGAGGGSGPPPACITPSRAAGFAASHLARLQGTAG